MVYCLVLKFLNRNLLKKKIRILDSNLFLIDNMYLNNSVDIINNMSDYTGENRICFFI